MCQKICCMCCKLLDCWPQELSRCFWHFQGFFIWIYCFWSLISFWFCRIIRYCTKSYWLLVYEISYAHPLIIIFKLNFLLILIRFCTHRNGVWNLVCSSANLSMSSLLVAVLHVARVCVQWIFATSGQQTNEMILVKVVFVFICIMCDYSVCARIPRTWCVQDICSDVWRDFQNG